MTIAELKSCIEAIPPGSQVPRDWILEQISKMPEANFGSMAWVTIKEAAAITGLSETWLRRKAPGWSSFTKPEIRVWKMNPEKQSSHWLFSTKDCEAYRAAHDDERTRYAIVTDHAEEPDDMDRLTEHFVNKVTVNL